MQKTLRDSNKTQGKKLLQEAISASRTRLDFQHLLIALRS
jgi:hypothetical protein